MAELICSAEFSDRRRYFDSDVDLRNRLVERANSFFAKLDNAIIINIIENWNPVRDNLQIVVYYKGYN